MPEKNTHQVRILLAVWGEVFIKDFFALSLPSLLAPGNLPAMAKAYPLTFMFLTRSQDIATFKSKPIFQTLEALCPIEFIDIEDLIRPGNHSTTLTLAYDRAVKHQGDEMLNTYFVFLTSDYIMADGSLSGLMRYMQKGYSGICAGNFQVVKKNIEPFLSSKKDENTHVMAIGSRELLKQSFKCFHPVTYASIINQVILHNYHANRFFFRYSNNLLAGRFFLMHMLCIKPETTDYQVGASCDYSFIPEMCPSGNIGIINDSDDYLVVEIQEVSHEINLLNLRAYNFKKLIGGLKEWTTKQHRANANHTIYFHTTDLTVETKSIVNEKLNQFVESISTVLNRYKPKPFRHHPYWIGAIDSFNRRPQKITDINKHEDHFPSSYTKKETLKKLYYFIFGIPPRVFPWHRRYSEFQLMMRAIKASLLPYHPDHTLVLYDSYDRLDFLRYAMWLKTAAKVTNHYYIKDVIKSQLIEKNHQFEYCMFFMNIRNIRNTRYFLAKIRPFLKPESKILLIFINENNKYPSVYSSFSKELIYKINFAINSNYQIVKLETIHDSLVLLSEITIDKISHTFSYNRKLKFLFYAIIGSLGSLFCLIRNILPFAKNKKYAYCTNILLTLTANKDD